MFTPFSCFPFVQELLLILHCSVACFTDTFFRHLSSPIFQVSLIFVLGTLDSSFRHVFDDRNVGGCFLDTLELRGGGGGGFPWSGGFMCVLALLPVWYYGMELNPLSSVLLLLSACSMAKGQEETSTSQAGHKRGPGWDTPSTTSIIFSLSMEELRSYSQILINIDFELLEGPTESTICDGDNAVYFSPEQLAVGLCFPILSLVKQFLHFFGAPPALIHLNVIRILTGCNVLNVLYQLDISLVEV